MFSDRRYFGPQVNYAPGMYSAIAISAPVLFMKFDSVYVCIAAWCAFFLAVIYNKPLLFLIKSDRIFRICFSVFSVFSAFLPVLILLIFSSNEAALAAEVMTPFGAVSVFLYLLFFFTHEKLQRYKWIMEKG